jgi:hypothetical protein
VADDLVSVADCDEDTAELDGAAYLVGQVERVAKLRPRAVVPDDERRVAAHRAS